MGVAHGVRERDRVTDTVLEGVTDIVGEGEDEAHWDDVRDGEVLAVAVVERDGERDNEEETVEQIEERGEGEGEEDLNGERERETDTVAEEE